MLSQRTVKSMVRGQGIGLHSGRPASFRVLAAPPDTGLIFSRTDHPGIEIPALSAFVADTRLATTLGKNGVTISTVEHLIAALFGLGVDNAYIEVDGPELPILDGSAQPFVDLIREAGGTVAQRRPKRFIVVRKPIVVTDPKTGKWARLSPAPSFQLKATIEFDHPLVNSQSFELHLSDTGFVRHLARARTFGFAKDIEMMHRAGLARGGSLDNAIVIDDFSIRNPDGLRFPDELVRHKILDAIGDLALLGAPIVGRYEGYKSGHALHAQLAQALLAQPRAFEYAEFTHRREVTGAHLELPQFRLGGMAAA